MKKLAIMFVMLLGSVATMQAQSFDFSCAEVVEDVDASGMDSFPDAEEMVVRNMNISFDYVSDDANIVVGFHEYAPGIYRLSFVDSYGDAISIGLTHLGAVDEDGDVITEPYVLTGDLWDGDTYTPRTYYTSLQGALDYIEANYPGVFQDIIN